MQTDIYNMKSIEIESSEKRKVINLWNSNMRKWVLLFKILRVIVNVEQPAKNKITKHMIMRGEYNPDPNRN